MPPDITTKLHMVFVCAALRAQRSDGTDPDSVSATICKIADRCENHEEGWCLRRLDVDFPGQRVKVRGTGFHKPFPAEFDLDEAVCAVSKMDDGIAFKSGGIPIMGDASENRFGIDTKVAHGHWHARREFVGVPGGSLLTSSMQSVAANRAQTFAVERKDHSSKNKETLAHAV